MKIKQLMNLFSMLLILVLLAVPAQGAAPPLKKYGTIDDFQLMDSTGEWMGLQELKGKVWVADFIFTTCGSLCPIMTKNLAEIYKTFKETDGLEFVSISVNPEQDSPEALAEYAKKYEVDTGKWHFLTGPRDTITRLVVKDFKLGLGDEIVFHKASFVLVDRQGRIRGYYDGTVEKDMKKLKEDLPRLLQEKQRKRH